MNRLIAFAASLAVNFALLGALDLSVLMAQRAPEGVVSIVQLPSDGQLAAYTHVLASAGP
ncbi:MAG TPA: hypothetical protein VK025_05975 [Steroidobacter sp.]|jgi:hypothetical protein|nr:hypothetical protein [Steroidobacteraceae bacterium]HLS80934.1 hypothetical protein [Steroidobacter sp.]